MKFVDFDADWADEFTVYGFAIMTTEQWNEYSEKLKKCDNIFYGFGTNEAFEDETGEDFLRNMKVSDITTEEADFLRRIFKTSIRDGIEHWGNFPTDPIPEDDDTVVDEW